MKSFMWADRLKDKASAEDARSMGEQRLQAMRPEPEVKVADIFKATLGE